MQRRREHYLARPVVTVSDVHQEHCDGNLGCLWIEANMLKGARSKISFALY